MTKIAIIAEYNPFHNGHQYMMKEARRLALQAENPADAGDCEAAVIAVMSGDFVQRGHCALLPKWDRARAAVSCGADLVLELPVWAACSSAEGFAQGAVNIINNLGDVDYLAFGAECESLDELKAAAELIACESPELSALIKENSASGMNYARARSEALSAAGFDRISEILAAPNNILAAEYLKQLILTGSRVKPLLIPRKGSGYFAGAEESGYAGAGWLRNELMEGRSLEELAAFVPAEALAIYKNTRLSFMEDAWSLIRYRLCSTDASELALTDGVTEGLENRAVRAVNSACDYESLVNEIKSKRYSRTAVERMLVRMLLGIKKKDVQLYKSAGRAYARVLAFSEKGGRLLREIRKNDGIKVISNISKEWPEDEVLSSMLKYDLLAADVYSIIRGEETGVELKSHAAPVHRG